MDKMKVSTRLAWGFGTLVALLAVIVIVGVDRLGGIQQALDRTLNDRVPKVVILQDMALRAMDNARIARNIVLQTTPEALASNKAAYDRNIEAVNAHIQSLESTIKHPTGVKLLNATKAARRAYEAYTQEVLSLGMSNHGEQATNVLYGESYKTQGAYFAAITQLNEFQKSLMDEAGKEAEASYLTARWILLIAGVLSVAMGAALAILIARSIARQLGGEPAVAAEVAAAVARGDLGFNIPVKPGDNGSLMAQLKLMNESLVRVVSAVRHGSENVATASAEIALGNEDLSSRTESQASALEETAASMDELGSTVRQNADSARQANQLAQTASSVALQGGDVVSRVVHTMKEINDSSKKIADIIGVIDGIAFQTNILALNAAVEAARAGEQGRGFAVVASEVRSLAGRSAEAAKEIKALITASVERVEAGTALVDQAGNTMEEVVASIRRVTDIMGEISSASVEQSAGVAQVGEAVTSMDQTTQQNAALVEEMAAAASSLKSQAQELVQAVAVFKLTSTVAGRTGMEPLRAA